MWRPQPSDFDLPNATPIGAGALSYVLRAEHIETKSVVAVKVLSKVQLLQQQKVEAVMNEKDCLYNLGPHPFIARLFGTTQSEDELYFIMEHLPNGDLLQHIRTMAAERIKAKRLREEQGETVTGGYLRCLCFEDIQTIMAQLVAALGHCIRKGYVLRDLKPENICFDSTYRCVLIDFDTATKCDTKPHTNHGHAVRDKPVVADSGEEGKRRMTVSEIQGMRRMTSQFCGTAQYVSPEMVGECVWSYSSDLWALGVICYQCLYGTYPFKGSNTFAVMKELIKGVSVDKHFSETIDLEQTVNNSDSKQGSQHPTRFERVRGFIQDLLRIDPTMRLGVDPLTLSFDERQLRGHPLFTDFDWSTVDGEIKQFAFKGGLEGLLHKVGTRQQPGTGMMMKCLNDVPKHSDEYSSYVMRLSNDSNPFEEWAHRCDDELPDEGNKESTTAEVSGKVDDDDDDDEEEESDEDDNVIDDVGMQNLHAADDFQE